MPADSIPPLSLGTAVLVIFLACAGFVMLRGMTRLLIGTSIFALSAWIGFVFWQESPGYSIRWLGKPHGIVTTGLPVIAFLGCWWYLRKGIQVLTSPFTSDDRPSGKSFPSPAGLVFRLLVALIPATVICLVGATIVHHAGAVAEVRASADPAKASPAQDYSRSMKTMVESVIPSNWLKHLDPLAQPARVALAKLVSAGNRQSPEPVTDPHTGKPIPRAIIVDDPELQTLVHERRFSLLLRHPRLTQALDDPQVQSLVKHLKF